MTLDEYQKLALRTANVNTFTEKEIYNNACLGLIGELGEVSDIIKKNKYQGHDIGVIHLMKELGDVLWYTALAVFAVKGEYGFQCALDEAQDFMNFPLDMGDSEIIFGMHDTINMLANHVQADERAIPLCGQLIQYIEAMALKHGSTLNAVMRANIAKLEERYPGAKFDPERSRHRKEGDI